MLHKERFTMLWKRFFLINLVMILIVIIGQRALSTKDIVLELGMFVGSNWDVADENSYKMIDRVIEEFEKQNEGVKVKYTSGIRKVDYSEWMAQQILKGKMPDVAMILNDDFERLVSLGVLQNLDKQIEKDKLFDLNKFYSKSLEIGKCNNSQYGLPYEIVPMMMIVNKSLLNKEGFSVPKEDWTWEDLYNISDAITKDTNNDGVIDQFATYNYGWTELVYSNGAQLFSQDGIQSYLTDQRVIDSVKFSKRLEELNVGAKVNQSDFDSGKVAFMPLSFAEYRVYKTYPYKLSKYTAFKWDCITMPRGEFGNNSSEIRGLLLGISNQSRHKKLAWELLKMFTYDEAFQMDIFRYSQGASPLKAVTESKQTEQILYEDIGESEKVIDIGVLSNIIDKGVCTPKFPRYREIMTLAAGEVDKILKEEKDVENTLRILQRTIESLLKN